MRKTTYILLLVLFARNASGLTLFGPPVPELKPHFWNFGFDYLHNDIDFFDSADYRITYRGSTYLARFGRGIFGNMDISIGLGISQGEITQLDSTINNINGFISSIKGRTLIHEFDDTLSLGITAILDYYELEQNESLWSVSIDNTETKIILGLSKNIENLNIYGGPYYRNINGDGSFYIGTLGATSGDLSEGDNIGVYLGASLELPIETLNVSPKDRIDKYKIRFELQHAEDNTSAGVSICFPFK